MIQEKILVKLIVEAIGKSSVISTSKIKKITAIKKNRREKGSRAEPLGSNPHSYGEFFSRSMMVFFAKTVAKIITKVEINAVIKKIYNIKKITFSKIISPFDWKSNILNILKKLTSSSVDKDV